MKNLRFYMRHVLFVIKLVKRKLNFGASRSSYGTNNAAYVITSSYVIMQNVIDTILSNDYPSRKKLK